MKTPRTFAEVLVDVESLLASVALNADQLPNLDVAKAPLETLLAELKTLATRRDNHKAEKQVLSQQMQTATKRARDLSANLRALLKGNLGTRNEKLSEFRVQPQRGKRKKKATDPAAAAKKDVAATPVAHPTVVPAPAGGG